MKTKLLNKKGNTFIFYFIGILFLFSNSQVISQANNVKIACVGNSITYGSHLDNRVQDCYPSQLNRMLSKVYDSICEVNNYGLSGRNMLKNAPKPIWDEPKFKEALEWAPDICIIILGTNDSPPKVWNNLKGEFVSDYLSMLDAFRMRNPNVKFIMGCPPPIWKGHPYGGDTWAEKHNDSILVQDIIPKIKTVSSKGNAILIDFYIPFINQKELFPDLLHPNPQGAKQIASMILEVIQHNNLVTVKGSSPNIMLQN